MYGFNYHRPDSIDAAASLCSSTSDGAYLAGGMTLLPILKQRLARPSDLIDLAAIPGLDTIEVTGDTLTIGAMARHAAVASSAEVRQAIPALAELAGLIGDAHVRNRGTIGGSVASSHPGADYPAAVIALGASIVAGKRSIAADDYFQGIFTTALDQGDVIRAIAFPIPRRAAYRKFPNPASRYALAGVFVADFGGGRVRVGVTGAGPCAFRPTALEEALSRNLDPSAVDSVATPHGDFLGDLHASAEYRGQLVKVLAKRAVTDLLAR